jgi:lipopolysaccharide transport system ATP-binding protein
MSPDPAVVTNGISKVYRLGEYRESYPTLRDSLARAASAPFRRRRHDPDFRDFWALRDINIEIPQGEAVGFIGRNGAGKTTLLKVLSRITEPTSGWADVRGRVGSLLEVGTGFHPELTGRENVFLNGAILGMTRAETRRRFDEIVAFAGVEEFLDTPVKRYSSGMYVRLAFAVAAHLEPEILIVDEVLAVGDTEFQRKCLGKMGDVASEGRTVLFVSHNLAVVQSLCNRAVHLDAGRCVDDGPTQEVVDKYLSLLESLATTDLLDREDRDRRGYREVLLKATNIVGGDAGGALATGRSATFEFELTGLTRATNCSFVVLDHFGLPVSTFNSQMHVEGDVIDRDLGSRFVCEIDELTLTPGRYRIDVVVRGDGHIQDGLEGAAYFDVAPGTLRDRPVTGGEKVAAPIAISHRWSVPPS